MTVIVTGATSFIGRAVVKALLEEGCRVVAVSRPASAGAGKLQELFEDLKKQAGAGKNLQKRRVAGKGMASFRLGRRWK